MSLKRATFMLATVLLALAPAGSVARAGGSGSCHWQLWPGPLDPNTSYPGKPAAHSPPATVKEILERTANKPAAHSPPATVKEILERTANKPPSVSTHTATPSH